MSTPLTSYLIPAAAEKFISDMYTGLQRNPDFMLREGQVRLSKAICQSFLTNVPLAAEAPTGTGKTLAYLIGALAAHAVGKENIDPIVVATATKALQAQLMKNDLPRLVAAGGIAKNQFVLAKGKANYFCLRDATDLQHLGSPVLDEPDEEDDVFEQPAPVDPVKLAAMIEAFNTAQWDGDFDAYLGDKPSSVELIKVKSETCSGKKCPHYNNCAYVVARNKLAAAKVIVANHDLTLIDLNVMADSDESSDGYFPAKSYYLVVDEAHNFPEKAITVGQTTVNIGESLDKVYRLRRLMGLLSKHGALVSLTTNPKWTHEIFEAVPLVAAYQKLMEHVQAIPVDNDSCLKRYPKGVIPSDLAAVAKAVITELAPVELALLELISALREFVPPQQVLAKMALAEATHLAIKGYNAITVATKGLSAFTEAYRAVRWVYKKDSRIEVHTSPLEGADVLKPILWNKPRAKPVFVSATLRDLDGFESFKRDCGIPDKSTFEVLPFIFPYENSKLIVAAMAATPKMAERREYLKELSTKVPADILKNESTLILAPSRTLMKDMAPLLKAKFGDDAVLVQGEGSMQLLLTKHKQRVALNQTSILIGLMTMAEGLDLPGNLCQTVMVLALPFAVPTDPVEEELAELLGPKYFSVRSLPAAMKRLSQMVGRLLRRESDIGRVVIYDRRLASTSYGRRMLAALPPYKKVIVPLNDK